MDALLLLRLQEPPDTVDESVAVAPTHNVVAPEIVPADGLVITVIVRVAFAEPQLLVIV